MNKVYVWALFALLAATSAKAQNTIVEFEDPIMEVGTIKEAGGPIEIDFYFTNKGPGKYFINKVEPACECTGADWPRDSIAVGQRAKITVTYDPMNRPGPFEKGAAVHGNSAPPIMMVAFQGTAEPREKTIADLYPIPDGKILYKNNLAAFGQVYEDTQDTIFIYAYNNGTNDLKIEKVEGCPDFIRFEMESLVIEPKTEFTIRLIFDGPKYGDLGEYFNQIYIHTNDVTGTGRRKALHIQAHVKQRFPEMSKKQKKRAPKAVFDSFDQSFGKLLSKDSATLIYKLTNAGKDPLIVKKLHPACGCTGTVIGKNVIKGGETTEIKAVFYPKGLTGYLRKFITVITNDPEMPEINLYLSGTVVQNPNALDY